MKKALLRGNDLLFGLNPDSASVFQKPVQFAEYTWLFIAEGTGIYHADFAVFPVKAPVLVFATPLQQIFMEQQTPVQLTALQFHGDFYCIEYHKVQVACNGLLFNNIYLEPCVKLTVAEARIFQQLLQDLNADFDPQRPDETVLRSYLQLLLAKSSSIKLRALAEPPVLKEQDELMNRFKDLLEQHFLFLHKPADYAELLAITTNSLNKRSKKYFGKTPSELIQERLILEAKKQLHLTRLSIKEIAYKLQFNDEFYFSRFFKKFTHVSPQAFRDLTGISVVADLVA
ncbi:AraC family transcriptional regulator [Adhaeribacter swui]|uniref:AraC family transcriptional regulator n=1 Tax=Adhaeribacter swui TaxID=2086471 RepID=A0A7G7G4Y6_9BACT|nr:helix-turn-helix transcriptional regulator [Adhaeribacter swui]QNF32220.1 AraC family transcriptional regulator [Adhaeribacter swui]